jgi:hypothetical protein
VYQCVICVGSVHGDCSMSDRIKAFLGDPYWLEHIKDQQPKQIKRWNFFDFDGERRFNMIYLYLKHSLNMVLKFSS